MESHICADRRERLRPILRQAGLDSLLVSLAANRYYLSGFELHDPQCNESSGYLLVAADGRDALLTDPRYTDAAARVFDPAQVCIYKPPRLKDIAAFLKGRGVGAMGIEAPALDVETFQALGAAGLDLRPVRGLVEKLRIIKDADEISAMRRACALNHQVFDVCRTLLTPGKAEAALAWELEQAFRNGGASELSFATIVGVGPNAALPHAIPGVETIREGELVLVDMGCRLDDYCSDQTRTFWVGDAPSARFRDTLELVQEAQQAALALVRPGARMADLYKAARAVFEARGVADRFTHGLGHGIGLETHEPPSLGPTAEGELKPGMIVTVEPGLYWPDWGGIRWEYMVLVTEDGGDIL